MLSSMATFKTLVRIPSYRLRLPFNALPILSSSSSPFSPSSGPLFLSHPPWKLSPSSTPLHLRDGDVISPPGLIPPRRFPYDLRLGLEKGDRDAVEWRRRLEKKTEVGASSGGEKLFNAPNLISFSRMVSGPFIGWMIMNELYLPAFCGLGVAGLTDWLDGFIARRMNINSVFGSYLDPLADKVLIGCVAVAMVKKDLLHSPLVGLVVFRDVALVSGAVYKRVSCLDWKWKSWSEFVNLDAARMEKVEPLFISKVNTVLQLLLVAGALLQPEYGSEGTQQFIAYMSWLVAATTLASSGAYGIQYLRHK